MLRRFVFLLLFLAATAMAFSEPNPVTLMNTFNNGGVVNRPSRMPVFVLDRPTTISQIQTYHWNNGRGASVGTISLKDANGRLFGPWSVTTSGGSGASNIFWTCHPQVSLPAGSYTVIDSEPSTWSHNGQSQGCGFALVQGTANTAASWTQGRLLQQISVAPGSTQTLTLPEGIKVTVPAGLLSSNTNLTVSSLEGAPPFPQPAWVMAKVYDISLGNMKKLTQPLTIELPFDPASVSPRYPARDIVEAVYFDEQSKEWVHLPGRIGPSGNTLIVKTRHLCPFGLIYFPVPTSRYINDREVSLYWGPEGNYKLTILWKDTPEFRQATKAYNDNYRATSSDPNLPPYIKQITSSAWDAVQAYSKLGFRPASESLHIYVDTVDSSYHSFLTHNIGINLAAQAPDELKYVVSHEVFHNFQASEYYLGEVMGLRWWIEATAEYASSRIAQAHYPAMGKIDPRHPGSSLSAMLTRRPLDYAYVHKGWLEGALDRISGQTTWDQFHAYRGAYFVDYVVRAGSWFRNQKGESTTPALEFKSLWDAVTAAPIRETGLQVFIPMDSHLQSRYGLGFAEFYGLFASHLDLHRESPVGQVASVTDHMPPTGAPLTMSFPVQFGPVAPYRAVKIDKKCRLECRLDVAGPTGSQAWIFVLPQGQALGGHFVQALWKGHQRPVLGQPVRLDVTAGDVVFLIAVCPSRAGGAVEASTLSAPMTVTLGEELGEGYWSLTKTGNKQTITNPPGVSITAVEGRFEANYRHDEVWQGRALHSEARANVTWTPFPARIKGGDAIQINIQPSLHSTNLTHPAGVRTKLFAQMLDIRPSHLTTAADSKQTDPAATAFRIVMPSIDKSVTIPITLTVDTSFAGQVIYTYEYQWIMPKKK